VDKAWGGLRALLVRRRVALGFVVAAAALILARPTWRSWTEGLVVALVGEAIRLWAAGHIEKGREVTASGPYRWTRHPLYVGSSLMAVGAIVATRSPVVAVVTAIYIVATLTAAITSEEAHLKQKFGDAYDRYARAPVPATVGTRAEDITMRVFSLERAMRNREYRAVIGLIGGFLILALKVAFNL
jgi:protein-S-isoprenylcysteine O-methyltransferase Ste14